MRAILTGIVATIEAIAVALASLVAVAAYAFLVWWLAFGLAAEPSAVFGGAGAAWLLAHFSPLAVGLSAEVMQVLGFAPEPLKFAISLAPLGITAVTAAFAGRAGWRSAARGGAGAAGVLGGALGLGAVAAILHAVIAHSGDVTVAVGWAASAGAAALVWAIPSGVAYTVRAARDEHGWWLAAVGAVETWLGRIGVRGPAAFPHRAGQAFRLAAMLLAAYVGLAALGMALALLTRFALVIAASEALQLDLWGTVLMFVLQVALVPVFVIWSGAWLTGSGFAVGVGSSASPFGQLLGPMPGIPVLAAIPDGWGSVAVIAPLLLVLAGLAIGIALGETARRQSLAVVASQVVAAAVVSGSAIALLNWAARGSLGPGRLAEAGPDVWAAAGLAALELGAGAMLGALAARADLARRVMDGPAEVKARLGLGDERPEGSPASVPADAAHVVAAPAPGAVGPEVIGSEIVEPGGVEPGKVGEPGEHLAPVSPLVPRSWQAAGAADDSDEQLTEPLEFDVDSGLDADVDADFDADATAEQPELFDQHEARSAADSASEQGATDAGTASDGVGPEGLGADSLDPDALVEAYSWDAVDLTEAPQAEGKRPGWRWPGRKG